MSSISHLKGPEIFWLCKASVWGTGPSPEVSELSHILGSAGTPRCTGKAFVHFTLWLRDELGMTFEVTTLFPKVLLVETCKRRGKVCFLYSAKCSPQTTYLGISCSLGHGDTCTLSFHDTMSFLCFYCLSHWEFYFFLRVFCSFWAVPWQEGRKGALLKCSLVKPEATGRRDWWILLTFQSHAVVRCSPPEKAELPLCTYQVFRLKPNGRCISKCKGYDLRGQTFVISQCAQKLNEKNFLLALHPPRFISSSDFSSSAHLCDFSRLSSSTWFCLLSTSAFTCLHLVLSQLKYWSSPS